jgi:hypothetical protein
MQKALLDAHDNAGIDGALPVSFVVDTTTRTCDMRDLLITLAFGKDSESAAAASVIARRLADAMDQRSKPCLLLTSVRGLKARNERHTAIWTFPRDEAFQFNTRADRINLLSDIFSRSSKLRKAATFEGRNTRTQFLSGRVLDYQANASDRFIADYWIDRFLGAQLQIGSEEGTTFLAKTLRAANEALDGNPTAREQLHAAIGAVRQSPKVRWSLSEFSELYLSGDAASAFAAASPNPDAMTAVFDFDRDRFDSLIQYRVYSLDTGVTVSAPFSEIGDSVVIEDENEERVLNARGRVVSEKIRARGR